MSVRITPGCGIASSLSLSGWLNHRPSLLVVSSIYADGRRLYNTLDDAGSMLDTISPQHHWKTLKELLTRHGIDPRPMGFAKVWQETPIWRTRRR